MPKDGRYDDLTALLNARGDALLRTAVLLTPGREAGQDLLQEALPGSQVWVVADISAACRSKVVSS
jgi:hypothetical protein